ncbi:MAG: ribosome small subunit-dependent GTPase A [Steroidobacterales bacterium]
MSEDLAQGTGLVLASYGRGVLVRAGDELLRCALLGRKLRPVCGDRVTWRTSAGADGPSVETIAPRRNLIERIDSRGRAEPVAANIDRLAVVIAPEPAPDWFLVDRYCAAASLKEIGMLLVANKSDLGLEALAQELAVYRALGLQCVEVACLAAFGLDRLRASLDGVTLLVGQSGVGKSSLVNALAPNAAAITAELTRDAEGRHTTTTARWYPLGGQAAIIDAPGVRDFAPPAHLVRAAERGFVEIHAISHGCRFNDCRHFGEPGCAVRAAVDAQRISARRYESYRRLARLYEELATD